MSVNAQVTPSATSVELFPEPSRKPRTFLSMAIHTLSHDWVTLAALVALFLIAGLALGADWISANLLHVGPNDVDAVNSFSPPYLSVYLRWVAGLDRTGEAAALLGQTGVPHWLGADQLGRDQLARLLQGGRISIAIAFFATLITLLLGVTVGLVAGFYGGRVDDLAMWIITTVASLPTLFLLLIVVAIFSPSATVLTVLLGAVIWVGAARLVRAQAFSVREQDYVLAAQSVGVGNGRIMFRHILPNVIPIVITNASIDIGDLILIESGLSFLGLGVEPPTATWGNMLTNSRSFFTLGPWLVFWPGIFITLTVLCLYVIGDGLRDALDPKLKETG